MIRGKRLISLLLALMLCLGPVSYTHLDVYKRQVLDYKTDQIYTPEGLIERYHSQLDYYAKALEQLTQKKVKEKIIYSFTIKKEIRLP